MNVQITTAFGKEVELSRIGSELKAFFAQDTSRTNACLMNLAVYTEDPEELHSNFRRIARLTENHACRALSIALDEKSEEEGITSWVTAHCNMSNGKKTVCCEQLTFLLKGLVSGRLRNTLFANLNSDLPLVFWWQGNLTPRFEPRLYTLIDRFIFDSCEWTNPVESYQLLVKATDEVQKRFVIQDLAWTRSYPMRVAFAAMFDQAIARDEMLNFKTASIKVGQGFYTTGLLMLSWLARQMSWVLDQRISTSDFQFRNEQGELVLARLEEAGSIPVAELGLASEAVSVLALHNRGASHIDQVIQTKDTVLELTSSAGDPDVIALVANQLSRGGTNTLLKKVLPMFIQLLQD